MLFPALRLGISAVYKTPAVTSGRSRSILAIVRSPLVLIYLVYGEGGLPKPAIDAIL
jgi:hypothetical protein